MSESSSIQMAGPHEPNPRGTAPASDGNWDKLDALFEGLPPGIPLLPPEDAGNFDKYTHRPRHAYAPGEGWKNCARALEKYDAELCKGYREEIDTLLVFAGLFSAVVTAFTIESYQWLQADANDAMIVLLSQIAQSVSPNNTVVPPVPAAASLPGSVSVRLNIYWFLALALSLSAALVAILCKQWIREFERNIGLSPKRFVGIHQTKLEGLERWKVGGIISLLPLLLQVALALFALGVLELLWQLHTATAAVVCVPAAVAFVFYAATTVLPALSSHAQSSFDCPYKSPQAMLVFPVFDICTWMRSTLAACLSYLAYLRSLMTHYTTAHFCGHRDAPAPSFAGVVVRGLELRLPEWDLVSLSCNRQLDHSNTLQPLSVYRSLRWIHRNLDSGDAAEWIWHCLWETALAPDAYVPGGAAALKRGFCYVDVGAGAAHVPPSGLRALALAYLMQPAAPWPFVVEAFVQNLSCLDVAGAEYLAGRMEMLAGTHSLAAEAMVSILGAASAYARAHAQEPIGGFLVMVTKLASRSARSAPALVGCATMLYHAWLTGHHLPAGDSTEELVWFVCSWLLTDPNPERLRRQVGAQELAELVSVYAQTHEDPAGELAVGMAPDEEEGMRVIVGALLDMARLGQDGEGDSALVQRPPLPHADTPPAPTLSRAQSQARDPSCSPSPGRHSARGSLSHARSQDPQPSRGPGLEKSVETEGERRGGSWELRDDHTS